LALKSQISLLLSISADEAVERIASLPEVEHRKYLMERSTRGLLIWRPKSRSDLEEYDFTRIELRVAFSPRGEDTEVVARIVERPKVRSMTSATGSAAANIPGSVLRDLWDVRKTMARRRRQKIELLNLISRALMPVSIAAEETGPYRE
jgi:hypothetical protein